MMGFELRSDAVITSAFTSMLHCPLFDEGHTIKIQSH